MQKSVNKQSTSRGMMLDFSMMQAAVVRIRARLDGCLQKAVTAVIMKVVKEAAASSQSTSQKTVPGVVLVSTVMPAAAAAAASRDCCQQQAVRVQCGRKLWHGFIYVHARAWLLLRWLS
jgi:hypothetical protein